MIYYLNEKKINLLKVEKNLNKIMFDINKLTNKNLKNILIKLSNLK